MCKSSSHAGKLSRHASIPEAEMIESEVERWITG
jgi:hypothetical protein